MRVRLGKENIDNEKEPKFNARRDNRDIPL